MNTMSFHSAVRLLLLALHVYLLAAFDANCTCGLSRGMKNRIVEGQRAEEGAYPWMVAIYERSYYSRLTFKCGGSLINDRFVLTAAHCLKRLTPTEIIIMLGNNSRQNLLSNFQRRTVKRIKRHKHFEYPMSLNDIALLELEIPLDLSTLSTICLPNQEISLPGKTGTIIGWGRLYEKGPTPDTLREANVEILPDVECHKSYKKVVSYFNEKKFCAGKEGKDACNGDSGGPFFIKNEDNQQYTQVGITSGGLGCGRREYPGVYVKVSSYINWIGFHTRQAIYCSNSIIWKQTKVVP